VIDRHVEGGSIPILNIGRHSPDLAWLVNHTDKQVLAQVNCPWLHFFEKDGLQLL
jgi:hypothetical protein